MATFDTLLKKAFSWAVANINSWVTPMKKEKASVQIPIPKEGRVAKMMAVL